MARQAGVTQSMIVRWMRERNVPRRSKSQALYLTHRQGKCAPPPNLKEKGRYLAEWRSANREEVREHAKEVGKLNNFRKSRTTRWVECAWPPCEKKIKRRKSKIEASTWFACSLSHRSLYQASLKRDAVTEEKSPPLPPPAAASPAPPLPAVTLIQSGSNIKLVPTDPKKRARPAVKPEAIGPVGEALLRAEKAKQKG